MMPTALMLCLLMPAEPVDLLEQARQAFEEGVQQRQAGRRGRECFHRAARSLEALRRQGASGAGLYRSLGNAWWLAEELPAAILAYRQGLRRHPGDRDLQAALESAREQVVYPEGSIRSRPTDLLVPGWLVSMPPLLLFVGLALAHLLGCVLATRACMLRRLDWLAMAGACWIVAVLTGSLLLQRHSDERPVVVIARDGVPLRVGNGDNYPAWSEELLHRGVEAVLRHRRGDWLQIELSAGEIGWIRADEALVEELPEP